MSHIKYRERLAVAHVGDCHHCQICGQGGVAFTNRTTLTI